MLKTPLKLFKQIDFFGASVTSHNLKGDTKVNRRFGGCFSLVILVVTLSFGFFKLEHMHTKKQSFNHIK